jgi:hypothetical protein
MATLIQLKQIESSSFLIQAAELAATFTQSVKDVINIVGTVSSSAQLTSSLDLRYALSGTVGGGGGDWSTITGIPQGIISASTQLDGSTLRNITISTTDADHYSLIVSGAIGVVDATDLSGSIDGDLDTTVPAQIYLTGYPLPTDPAVSGSSEANIIDQGEW